MEEDLKWSWIYIFRVESRNNFSNYGYSAERKHLSGATRYPRFWVLLVAVVYRGSMATGKYFWINFWRLLGEYESWVTIESFIFEGQNLYWNNFCHSLKYYDSLDQYLTVRLSNYCKIAQFSFVDTVSSRIISVNLKRDLLNFKLRVKLLRSKSAN